MTDLLERPFDLLGLDFPGAPLATRFWDKVDLSGICWEWTAALSDGGYGRFWLYGRNVRAHHVAWMLLVGPCPAGLVPDHLCRNRLCVCPDHLEWVTSGENTRRGFGPAGLASRATHCPKLHPYAGGNLIERVQKGRLRRECRTCVNDAKRAAYARRNR